MKTIELKVYEYNELSENAQNVVLSELVNDWIEVEWFVPDEAREGYDKAVEEMERMRTPWFLGEAIFEYCHDWIMAMATSRFYYENGDICWEATNG